jgi:hypothetical protein
MAERSAKRGTQQDRAALDARAPGLRRTDGPIWRTRAFWDEVEVEIEAFDPYDLLEFLTADEQPISSRPSFRAELRVELAELVRGRYQH